MLVTPITYSLSLNTILTQSMYFVFLKIRPYAVIRPGFNKLHCSLFTVLSSYSSVGAPLTATTGCNLLLSLLLCTISPSHSPQALVVFLIHIYDVGVRRHESVYANYLIKYAKTESAHRLFDFYGRKYIRNNQETPLHYIVWDAYEGGYGAFNFRYPAFFAESHDILLALCV